MGIAADEAAILDIAAKWKWSAAETKRAKQANIVHNSLNVASCKRLMAVEGFFPEVVYEVIQAAGRDDLMKVFADWNVPAFPVMGADLIKMGLTPGKNFGKILDNLKAVWIDSDYSTSKKQLMEMVS